MMLISLGDYKFYSMLDQMQLQAMFSPYLHTKSGFYPRPILSQLHGQSIVLVSFGVFNPSHYFHLRMLERARDYLEKTLGQTVFEAVFSPLSNAFGNTSLIANEHRIRMLELATRDSDWTGVSGWQSRQQMAQNYTKVLRHLKKEYATRLGPNAVQLMMVCGSDTLEALTCPNSQIDEQLMLSNFELEELVSNYGLIVLTRPNTTPYKTIYSSDILRRYEKNIYVINDETSMSSLSSTRLRMALRRNESIRFCLDDGVLEYIERNNLYRSTPKRPVEIVRQESVDSVSLDELLEISAKWTDYFSSQLATEFMDQSTHSLPNTTRTENTQMNISAPAVFSTSPPHSPQPASKSVHFNLNSRGSTVSEPCSPRQGVRLKFRQFNLSGTPETSL